MSQSKTVVPGMDQGGDNYSRRNQQPPYDGGMYSRNSQNRRRGTAVPGMDNYTQPAGEERPSGARQNVAGHKPIVGFVYSISRTSAGEFWPLHIGQNVIGSAPDCDIVLPEATVSQRHAILHINKMKKPEKTEATISDSQSTNGTMLNGESVSVSRPVECFDRDIITIGENYELLVLLVDVKACGLAQAENFIPLEEEEYEADGPSAPEPPYGPGKTVNLQDFPPHFTNPDSPYSRYTQKSDSTVSLDPTANPGYNKGGTVHMD